MVNKKKVKKVLSFVAMFFTFFFFIDNVSALVQNEYSIYYNYYEEDIFETIDPNFIGEEGYLEILRKVNSKYAIFFSSDDIFIIDQEQTSASEFPILFNIYLDNKNKLYTSISAFYSLLYGTHDLFILKLSDFDNFDDFYSAFINDDLPKVSRFNNLSISNFSNNILYSDLNYFSYSSGNYVLLYDTALAVNFSFLDSFSNYSRNLIINGSEYTNNDILPSYYDTFGIIDDYPILDTIQSIDYEFNLSELLTFNTSVEVKALTANENLKFDGFELYMKKCSNNYCYYEQIVISGSNNGCYFDYSDYVRTSTSVILNNFHLSECSNVSLDNVSSLYLKLKFNGLNNAFVTINDYNSSGSHSDNNLSYINPFSNYDKYIIQKNYLTKNNVFVISTSENYYDKYIYYSHGHNVYNGVSYMTTSLNKFNYQTKKSIYNSLSAISNSLNNYYGITNRLNFNSFGTSEKTGIYFWGNQYLEESDVSEFYTVFSPVNSSGDPILFFGSGYVDSDLSSFVGTYIDDSGNIDSTNKISGDFSILKKGPFINLSFISDFFKRCFSNAKVFLNSSIEILSLVTMFFYSLSLEIQAFLLLLFLIISIKIFLRVIS